MTAPDDKHASDKDKRGGAGGTHTEPERKRTELEASGPFHDSQLPILLELEAEFDRELRALYPQSDREDVRRRMALPAHIARRMSTPARATRRVLAPARVTRRALVLVALVSLVGASALAARSVLGGSHRASSAPELLAAGGPNAERWQLQSYLYEGSLCYSLFVVRSLSSVCGAPGETGVRVSSILGPTRRFVVGLAGARVAWLRVRIGARTLLVATHPVPQTPGSHPATQARDHGPATPAPSIRWFIASLSSAAARSAPALLIPLDGARRPVGSPLLDCDLGGASGLCQSAAAKLATFPR